MFASFETKIPMNGKVLNWWNGKTHLRNFFIWKKHTHTYTHVIMQKTKCGKKLIRQLGFLHMTYSRHLFLFLAITKRFWLRFWITLSNFQILTSLVLHELFTLNTMFWKCLFFIQNHIAFIVKSPIMLIYSIVLLISLHHPTVFIIHIEFKCYLIKWF